MNTFGVGELVRVLEDMDSVKRLQAGHGEWTDSMAPVRSNSSYIYSSATLKTITLARQIELSLILLDVAKSPKIVFGEGSQNLEDDEPSVY